MQILGIKPDADMNEINKALRQKRWEHKGNEAMLTKLSGAADKLMMASLNARLQVSACSRDYDLYCDCLSKRWAA